MNEDIRKILVNLCREYTRTPGKEVIDAAVADIEKLINSSDLVPGYSPRSK